MNPEIKTAEKLGIACAVVLMSVALTGRQPWKMRSDICSGLADGAAHPYCRSYWPFLLAIPGGAEDDSVHRTLEELRGPRQDVGRSPVADGMTRAAASAVCTVP